MLATGQKFINDNLNQLSWHDTAIHSILFPDENKIGICALRGSGFDLAFIDNILMK